MNRTHGQPRSRGARVRPTAPVPATLSLMGSPRESRSGLSGWGSHCGVWGILGISALFTLETYGWSGTALQVLAWPQAFGEMGSVGGGPWAGWR